MFGNVPVRCNDQIDIAKLQLFRSVIALENPENNPGLRRVCCNSFDQFRQQEVLYFIRGRNDEITLDIERIELCFGIEEFKLVNERFYARRQRLRLPCLVNQLIQPNRLRLQKSGTEMETLLKRRAYSPSVFSLDNGQSC